MDASILTDIARSQYPAIPLRPTMLETYDRDYRLYMSMVDEGILAVQEFSWMTGYLFYDPRNTEHVEYIEGLRKQ